tara:strand:+ start:666 stop:1013 length:348 start_codon:yes stop_codon:yes gene_type:complete
MPVNIFLYKIIFLSLCFIKKTDKQKTRAILDIFEPIALPTARLVSFCSADSMDKNISGAEVAMPIMKKLAINPEIEYLDENRSVDVTKRLDPINKSTNPKTKYNVDTTMIDGYHM